MKCKAVCERYSWAVTRAGKNYLHCSFRLLDGEGRGESVSWFAHFSDKAKDRSMQGLRYMGWKGDDLSNLGPLDWPVRVELEADVYNGKQGWRVRWVNHLTRTARTEAAAGLDEKQVRLFAAQMKADAAKIPEAEKPSDEPGAGPQGTTEYGDLPF